MLQIRWIAKIGGHLAAQVCAAQCLESVCVYVCVTRECLCVCVCVYVMKNYKTTGHQWMLKYGELCRHAAIHGILMLLPAYVTGEELLWDGVAIGTFHGCLLLCLVLASAHLCSIVGCHHCLSKHILPSINTLDLAENKF